jgi:NAD(P) transhydrogenase
MSDIVDACVIGSGAAGQKAALMAAKLGKRVIVVEREQVCGGAMINTGTVPSKALREVIQQELVQRVRRSADATRRGDELLAFALDSTRKVINAEHRVIEEQFRRSGVEVVRGDARFRSPVEIEVVEGGRPRTFVADRVFIATGSSPAKPTNFAFDGEHILTSDDVLRLRKMPRSMIIVGGGVIGTEYAAMFTHAGVEVTLVEGKTRLLDFVDGQIGESLQYQLRKAGLILRLGESVVKVARIEERIPGGPIVEAVLESGKTLRADALMYCVGRQGNTEALNLESAGLRADGRGRISVNSTYQTQVDHIYAIGDVIGFPALASTSMEQGRIAACHAFGARCESFDALFPYGIYTIPEVSMAGWTEERLTAEQIPYESSVASYHETARGQMIGDEQGMLKLLIHQESHTILGVHAIGTSATELIHIGVTAMAHKATIEYFVNAVFNYPTLAECYKIAAMNAVEKLRRL